MCKYIDLKNIFEFVIASSPLLSLVVCTVPVIFIFNIGSVYFAIKMLTAMGWLELLCPQSKAWQKRSKNKR